MHLTMSYINCYLLHDYLETHSKITFKYADDNDQIHIDNTWDQMDFIYKSFVCPHLEQQNMIATKYRI